MDIRFTQPFRRWLLKLSDYFPKRIRDKFLEWMYPDDAVITFKEKK